MLLPLLLLLLGSTHGFMQLLQSQFPASTVVGNRIVCQNFTDFLPSVVFMYAADDFVVPQPDLALRYTALQLQLGLVRMKHDENPRSLTVQLLRNNDADDSPGRAFYAHTYVLNWSDRQLDVPFNLTLRLSAGDSNELDNGRTQFDPMDELLLPRDTRMWLAVYATGPRNWAMTMAENSLFWSTAAPGARNASLSGAVANRPYYFRDTNNALREGFVNWTAAPTVERVFGMDSVSHNLAWSLALVAQDTGAPTGPPTNETGAPTAVPIGTAVPTDAPTDDEEIVWPNVTAPTTGTNGTNTVLTDSSLIRIAVTIALCIIVTCCLACLCLYYCIKRRKMQQLKSEKVKLENLDGRYSTTEANDAIPLETFNSRDGSIARSDMFDVSLERSSEATSTGGRYSPIESIDEQSFVDLSDQTIVTMRHRPGGGGGGGATNT